MLENSADKLPLQLLEALLRFAEAPSMEVAARQLGVTQPALSKQLKSLETRLAFPIFAQEGKRKVLTAFGGELVKEIRPRLAGLEADLRQVRLRHAGVDKLEVRISARREVLDRVAPKLKFEGRVVFLESGHAEILRQLRLRESDIGISYEAPDSAEFVARPLFRESFQLLLPKQLLGRIPADTKWAEGLRDLPAVSYRPNDEILEQAARHLGLEGLPQIARITDNYQSLFAMIEAGLGWGVVPAHFQARTSWTLPLPARSIQGREFRLIYRKELAKARWMKELLIEINRTFTPGNLRA